MTGIFLIVLYVTSGFCAFAALHHGLATAFRRAERYHLLFSLASLAIAAMVMARAGAYGAQTADQLVALRRWEISTLCLFVLSFLWFVADYIGHHPRGLLLGLTGFWALLLIVNLSLPYGVQFVELPRLSHFLLPWGESVVDLRVLRRGPWHNLMWLGIIVSMAYCLHACHAQYRRGHRQRARGLATALGLFFALALFNVVVNLGLVKFIHTSDFGFVTLIVLMDLEMLREARCQKQRMGDVLDHLPVAICLKDLDGRHQLTNRTFQRYFGANPSDLENHSDFVLFTEEQAERFRRNEVLAVEKGQVATSEYVREWNGKTQIIELRQYPMRRTDGTVFGVCCVHMDMTDDRIKDDAVQKLRQQVWHSDRMANTGAITSSLAHELCQPLSAILNNAQAGLRFLERVPVDLQEMRELLEDIVRDDKRAGAVINGLRAMLRQQETHYADVDLTQCVEEVLELLHSEIIRLGVEVESRLEAGLAVQANKTQVQQVVLNLVLNALEAMADQAPGQRHLRVQAARADGQAQVSVRDTGIGIPADKLERVFDGFYTTKPQGLGVGLEVCRSIIESHSGAVWAEVNPDRGATLHFTLPLDGEAGAKNPGKLG